jgi:phenylalanyl-tRNA synthetase alpha chain
MIMSALRENETRVLSTIKEFGKRATIPQIIDRTGLQDAAVMRAVLALSEKDLVNIHERTARMVQLNQEGTSYAQLGLPESRLVKAVLSLGGEASLDEAISKAHLGEDIIPIVLGWIRRKRLAEIQRREGLIYIRSSGQVQQDLDEATLRVIYEKGEVSIEELPPQMNETVSRLKSRNLLELLDKVDREVELTSKGLQTQELETKTAKTITALTAEIITSGEWRGVELRQYDVNASPPTIYPGKKNAYVEFMEEARRILLTMGFAEHEGPLVEAEFWNFDVLFQAQDHPAREIHDSYILRNPTSADLDDEELVERVRRTHENGWKTGSTGWGYTWNQKIAERLILRTQTTAVSMRYLSSHKNPPVKMFCLSKVFRPDVLDAKHSMEFTQLEGIVGDRGINLRHLLGFLETFASAMRLGKIRFKPGYFPFTEPSVESFIKHPTLGWVEFVGAGMFRPEVLKPLGIDFPVIAWGIGFDRLAMIALGINDIRDLHSKRLEWLREKPIRW